MNEKGGYTWARGQCQSRLDYLFISKYLATKMTKVGIDWAFEQSDRAFVSIEMCIRDDLVMGPGLTKARVLEDLSILMAVKVDLEEMLAQIQIHCMYAPLRRRGIEKLYELCMEAEIEDNVNEVMRIGNEGKVGKKRKKVYYF